MSKNVKFWGSVVLAVLFVFISVPLALDWAWGNTYQAELKKLKKAGHPTTIEALTKKYHARTDHRMDPEKYQSRYKITEDKKWVDLKAKVTEEPIWGYRPADVRKKLAGRIKALFDRYPENRETLLSKPVHPAELDFSLGYSLPLPHVGEYIDEARILGVYARWALEAGREKVLKTLLNQMFARARTLMTEPILISHLAGAAVYGITHDPVLDFVNHTGVSADLLNFLKDHLRAGHFRDSLIFAMEGEAVIGKQSYERIRQGELQDPRDDRGWTSFGLSGPILTKNGANLMGMYRKILNGIQQPYYVFVKKSDAIEDQLESGWGVFNALSRLLLPSLKEAYRSTAAAQAKTELLRMAVKTRLQQIRTGSLPPPGDIPEVNKRTDPFSGTPYRVVKNPREYRLYSVGPNRTDDGATMNKHQEKGDIVIRLASDPSNPPGRKDSTGPKNDDESKGTNGKTRSD